MKVEMSEHLNLQKHFTITVTSEILHVLNDVYQFTGVLVVVRNILGVVTASTSEDDDDDDDGYDDEYDVDDDYDDKL